MVEETVVVVCVLQWEDGGGDEFVDGGEVRDQVWGVFEVHAGGGRAHWGWRRWALYISSKSSNETPHSLGLGHSVRLSLTPPLLYFQLMKATTTEDHLRNVPAHFVIPIGLSAAALTA